MKKNIIRTIYPQVRKFTADTGRINQEKHYIRTLLEVDVTQALQNLKDFRAPGKKVSFMAWFIKILADCVADHPPVDGVQGRHNTVYSFKNIDVSTIVEKRVEGVGVPLPLVLRDVNHRTVSEVEEEIRFAIHQEVENEGDYILGRGRGDQLMSIAASIPQWARLFFMRHFILRNPQRLKKMMGTVMVTSLGMKGQISGWIIPTSMHPLSIGIGTLNKKPAIYQGEIQKRNILHLTIAIDHDVIDGVPAMHFVDALVSRMEAGSVLGTS